MVIDISEKNFEATIEDALLVGGPDARAVRDAAPAAGQFTPGGYHRRTADDYDRALCLIPQDALDFIYATQPKEWDAFKKMLGNEARERLLKRLASEIEKRGALDVLRNGVKCDSSRFRLACFHPASGLNAELQRLYEANIFSVVRQLHYSRRTDESVDMGIFLNGLPVITAELKNPLSGQNVTDATAQYRLRDVKEPLLAFGRSLCHFAVDPELAYMTTSLAGTKTEFLPFNRGHNGGAGNPPVWQGFATAYLWEQVWARDSVLDLVQNFVQIIDLEDDKGRKTGKRKLVFPRYHQLDCVRRLVSDARAKGAGQHYLIQHSAGSGKSNSIAWLAYQLSVLHDAHDRRVFDSIIVVTDRRVLDRQLQRTVRQFEHEEGVLENIDTTSRQLRQALADGKTIIVTTLQKFPEISGRISELSGQRFAVIIDEAHSSQSGESTKGMRDLLAEDEEIEDDLEQRIVAEIKRRGRLPNVSYFAFTATPRSQTLELFGERQPDGTFAPFSLYSMRQAIEEHFILDVLESYTTYQTYWNLLKTIKDDPRYERDKADFLLKSFVELHEHAINAKVRIMIEHFASQTMQRMGGKAKAMVVTRSRLHAVHYKQAIDRYLIERGYTFKTLVAFSDKVTHEGQNYTEAGMNSFPETQTAEMFKRDEYRILICANKFQTGFDQPLLHTMYVDKKLEGVNAVQTLSRLNRMFAGKSETMALDFVNDTETIRASFQPYYDRTLLTEATDPNLLYDLQTRLDQSLLYTQADVDRFADAYFRPTIVQSKLYAALRPVADRYTAAADEDKANFRGSLKEYVRLYAFLSQILPFKDVDLEKLYEFGRLLLHRLPVARERLPEEIQRQIDIDSYRIEHKSSGRITLDQGLGKLRPVPVAEAVTSSASDVEPLSMIITDLNERFGTHFAPKDKVFIEQLEAKLNGDTALQASVKVNPPQSARLTFDHVANDRIQDMITTNFEFYKQVTDNPEFGRLFFDWLFDRYLKRTTNGKK